MPPSDGPDLRTVLLGAMAGPTPNAGNPTTSVVGGCQTEITVVGDDDTGLIARVTTLLFERDINIEDLDQAVRDGVFRMTMHVDAAEMTCSQADLRAALQ